MRTNDVWGRLRGLSYEYDALYDLRWGALQLRFHLNSQNGPALFASVASVAAREPPRGPGKTFKLLPAPLIREVANTWI